MSTIPQHLSNAQPTIRAATVVDARAIAEVQVATWQTSYRGIVADAHLAAMSVDDRVPKWTTLLAEGAERRRYAFVAVSLAGQVIGYSSGGPIREEVEGFDGELYAIYVLPDHHGAGLGRRLLAPLVRALMEDRLNGMLVRVLASNPARKFYEHLGAEFVRDGSFSIEGVSYADVWYGWRDVHLLEARLV